MHPEGLFSGLNALPMLGWLALALAPLQRTLSIAFARILVLLLAVAYLAQLFLTSVPVDGGGFTSLAGVTAAFSVPANVMLGWTHYLAFDLFIGSWETEDAAANGVPHWLLLPCLFTTAMVGPVGLLLYFAIKFGKQRFFPA